MRDTQVRKATKIELACVTAKRALDICAWAVNEVAGWGDVSTCRKGSITFSRPEWGDGVALCLTCGEPMTIKKQKALTQDTFKRVG